MRHPPRRLRPRRHPPRRLRLRRHPPRRHPPRRHPPRRRLPHSNKTGKRRNTGAGTLVRMIECAFHRKNNFYYNAQRTQLQPNNRCRSPGYVQVRVPRCAPRAEKIKRLLVHCKSPASRRSFFPLCLSSVVIDFLVYLSTCRRVIESTITGRPRTWPPAQP